MLRKHPTETAASDHDNVEGAGIRTHLRIGAARCLIQSGAKVASQHVARKVGCLSSGVRYHKDSLSTYKCCGGNGCFPRRKTNSRPKNDDQRSDPLPFVGMPWNAGSGPLRCRLYPSHPYRFFLMGSLVIDRFGDFSRLVTNGCNVSRTSSAYYYSAKVESGVIGKKIV